MRRALIINGTGFTACSQACGSLTTLLRSARLFDVVQETSLGSWTADNDVTPDLILPRLLMDDWASPRLEACKKAWTSVKTFALLCGRNAKQEIAIRPSLVEVDDFLVCPYEQNELMIRLLRLIKDRVPAVPAIQPPDNRQDLDPVIGDSQPFLQAMHRVNLFARSKAAVVISGETGSGKELLARAIHYQSARKSKPFIPVNCGALPDELFENELFGHLKGAYTNAAATEKGLIAEAEGGTLFLDEVDTLSPAAQVKLLRFLQSGEYRPLGSSRATVADVRIISATNTDLARLVELKIFREDLLFRLNVLSLTIPPLRERGVDVLRLAAHFLTVYARQHDRPLPRLSEKVSEEFLKYSWPGNVRELESMIQRAIVMQDSGVLTPRDFALPTTNQPQREAALFQKAKSQAIGHFESNFIAKLLALHDGNISRAAKAAGKDRRSFQRLVTKYALDRTSFKNQAS